MLGGIMTLFVGFGAMKDSSGIQVELLISTLFPSFFTMLRCVCPLVSFSENLLHTFMCLFLSSSLATK